MRTVFAFLLMLPVMANSNAPENSSQLLEDEITIVMVGNITQVTGPNKTLIEVFDDSWRLVEIETECQPITVSIDLSAHPDGDYHVRVTTTTGTVTETVTKG